MRLTKIQKNTVFLTLLFFFQNLVTFPDTTHEQAQERLDQCHRRISGKLAPVCQEISKYCHKTSQSDIHILKSVLRTKINILASGVSSDSKELLIREQNLLKQLSQEGQKLYSLISKKALELNHPSPFTAASKISFETESFLAGIINLLSEWGSQSLIHELKQKLPENNKPQNPQVSPPIINEELKSLPIPEVNLNKESQTTIKNQSVKTLKEDNSSPIIEQTEPIELNSLNSAFALSEKTNTTQIKSNIPTQSMQNRRQNKRYKKKHDKPIEDQEKIKEITKKETNEAIFITEKPAPQKSKESDLSLNQYNRITPFNNDTLDDGDLLKLKEREFYI